MGLRASSRTAFSLLELLVVISIVLFLAAVFFPVIPHRHGQGKAKQSACASNLKQSALAALSYAEDHDGTLPPVWSAGSGVGPQRLWYGTGERSADLLSPYVYVRSGERFLCPSAPRGAGRTYLYNDLAAGRQLAKVSRTQHSVLFMDGEDLPVGAGHAWTPGARPADCVLASERGCLPGRGATLANAPTRHNGSAVYTFLDGHAKAFKPYQVFFPPRSSDSAAHRTADRRVLGPDLGTAGETPSTMPFNGMEYRATFHVR